MPKPPDITAVDQLATNTAKRLDRHINRSGEVHRELRARIAELLLRVEELELQRRAASSNGRQ